MAYFSSRKQTNSKHTHTHKNITRNTPSNQPHPHSGAFSELQTIRWRKWQRWLKPAVPAVKVKGKTKSTKNIMHVYQHNITFAFLGELKILFHPPRNQWFFLDNRYNETVWVIAWDVGYMLRNTCMLIYFVWIIRMGDIFKPQCFVHIFRWFSPWCFSLLVSWGVFCLGYEKQ